MFANQPPVAKRVEIPLTPNSPPGLVEALTVDPWEKSGKYGRGWTYFSLTILATATLLRVWHWWQDKIRQALHNHDGPVNSQLPSSGLSAILARQQTKQWQVSFISNQENPELDGRGDIPLPSYNTASRRHTSASSIGNFSSQSHLSSIGWINEGLALFRWVFYRSVHDIHVGRFRLVFSSLSVLSLVVASLTFCMLYSLLPPPLYWKSIRYGSPPVAIRAGMIAVAMTPWILATSTKVNLLSLATGIGPERLNVVHRWLGYLCLLLSLVHAIPFYLQPVWADNGLSVFANLFQGAGPIYRTGIACLVPLLWLCFGSIHVIRRVIYEIFTILHYPAAAVYLGLLFWHTRNFLGSWSYLWATVVVWALCSLMRPIKLNWINPLQKTSFLVGDQALITLLPEKAIKVTIPTRMKWRPGQYVYLRLSTISPWENHPFTISSLCSSDFPSGYGDKYRDCVLLFRPYAGFTKKVLAEAIQRGPMQTYQAFLDGPYGGMCRELAAFDTCLLIAGGSGITSLISHLLHLIKQIREGKAITRRIVIVWVFRHIEALTWFHDELAICLDSAPATHVSCRLFVTGKGAKYRHPNIVEQSDIIQSTESRYANKLESPFALSQLPFVARIVDAIAFNHNCSIEHGRPDLGYMLHEWATGGPDGRGLLGRRTAVFVCGPPSMRVGVANTVAKLQSQIWGDERLDEIYLHTENYAL